MAGLHHVEVWVDDLTEARAEWGWLLDQVDFTREAEWADAGIRTVTRLGDCLAPGIIAAAVYSGHQYARTYMEPADRDRVPFRREDIARLY